MKDKKQIRKQIKEARKRNIHFYYAECIQYPLRRHTCLFESNNGFSMDGDPKAIFDVLLADKSYSDFQYIWIVRNKKIGKAFEAEYRRNHQVHFITNKSRKYIKYMAQAKYLVSNTDFPAWFIRREDQMYIKTEQAFQNFKTGFHKEENYLVSAGEKCKDYLCSNIIVSPSSYYTEEVFRKQYKLENIYEGKLLEIIAPRHEVVRDTPQKKAKIVCRRQGLCPQKKQILIIFGKNGLLDQKIKFAGQLERILDSKDYQICMKLIPPETAAVKDKLENTDILVLEAFYRMNEWLAAADIVVGDGAGDMFDFMATGRMVIFTDLYKLRGGEIIPEDELPGAVAHTPLEVFQYIRREDKYKKKYKENYIKWKKRLIAEKESGFLESRNIKHAFNIRKMILGKKLSGEKEKVLIISPLNNQDSDYCEYWQLSLFQMLNRIDYERYDVTLVSDNRLNFEAESRAEKQINKNVRVFYRTGRMVQIPREYISFHYAMSNLFYHDNMKRILRRINPKECSNEWIRILGYASFDYAVYYGPLISCFCILMNSLDVKKKWFYDQRDYEKIFTGMRKDSQFLTYNRNLLRMEGIFDVVAAPDEERDDFLKKDGAESKEKKEKRELAYGDEIYRIEEQIVFDFGRKLSLILKEK